MGVPRRGGAVVTTIRGGPSVGGVVIITVGTLYGIHVVGTDVAGDCGGVAEDVVGRAGVGRDDVGGWAGARVLASGESVGASVSSSGIVAGASTTTRTRRAPLRQSCPSGGGGSGGGG